MIPSDSLISVHPADNVSYSGHCTAARYGLHIHTPKQICKQQHLCVQKSRVLSAVYKLDQGRLCQTRNFLFVSNRSFCDLCRSPEFCL